MSTLFQPIAQQGESKSIPVAVGQKYKSVNYPLMIIEIKGINGNDLIIDLLTTTGGIKILPATNTRMPAELIEPLWVLIGA